MQKSLNSLMLLLHMPVVLFETNVFLIWWLGSGRNDTSLFPEADSTWKVCQDRSTYT